MSGPDDLIQVLCPREWIEQVNEWLAPRDLYLAGPIPVETDFDTFVIGVRARRLVQLGADIDGIYPDCSRACDVRPGGQAFHDPACVHHPTA